MSQSEGKILPLHLTAPRSRDPRPQAAVGGEPELQEVARRPLLSPLWRETGPERTRWGSEEMVGRSNQTLTFLVPYEGGRGGSPEGARALPGPLVNLAAPRAKLQESEGKWVSFLLGG